jgi:hypothetical protein
VAIKADTGNVLDEIKEPVTNCHQFEEAAAEKAARESTARQKELATKKKLWEKYDKSLKR